MARRAFEHKPDWAVSPGEIISERLRELGRTQTWLALRMRRPLEQVNRLVNGRIGLRPATAIQLESALKQPAIYWLNLEAIYRLHLARKKERK